MLKEALKLSEADVPAGILNVAYLIPAEVTSSPSDRIWARSLLTTSSPSAVRRLVTGPPSRNNLPAPTGICDTEDLAVSDEFWTYPIATPPTDLRSPSVGATQTSGYVRLSALEKLVGMLAILLVPGRVVVTRG